MQCCIFSLVQFQDDQDLPLRHQLWLGDHGGYEDFPLEFLLNLILLNRKSQMTFRYLSRYRPMLL